MLTFNKKITFKNPLSETEEEADPGKSRSPADEEKTEKTLAIRRPWATWRDPLLESDGAGARRNWAVRKWK